MSLIEFDSEVVSRSFAVPVLVDFWAPWCAPCRALTPVLEKAAERHSGRFELVKLNTEEQPEVAERYQVRGIPNVKLFVDGKVIHEFTGAMSAEMLDDWLARALPSALRKDLQQAAQKLAEGLDSEARELLERIVTAEPDNGEAAVLLARLLLPIDTEEAVSVIARIGPDSEFYASAEAIRTFARLFRLVANPDELPDHAEKVAYLKAVEHLTQGSYEPALEGFIGVVKSARAFDDDGARRACVAIFRHLGDDHELTRRYRSSLSRALYV